MGNLKKIVLTILKLCSGAVYFIAGKVDFKESLAILSEMSLWYYLAVLLLLSIQIIVSAKRWHDVLVALSIQLPIKFTIKFLWVGVFFNQTMLSSIGGDVIRGYYLKKVGGCGLGVSAIGILLDRVSRMNGLNFAGIGALCR